MSQDVSTGSSTEARGKKKKIKKKMATDEENFFKTLLHKQSSKWVNGRVKKNNKSSETAVIRS